MGKLIKTANKYRVGDNWRENFQYINYPNIETAVKRILTVKERIQALDRFGNRVGATATVKKLSIDEQAFRIAVLLETEVRGIIEQRRTRMSNASDAKPNPQGDNMKQEIQEILTNPVKYAPFTIGSEKTEVHLDHAEYVKMCTTAILQAIADKLPEEHPKTGTIKMIIEGREYTRPAESDIAVGYNQAISDVKSALGLEERR